MSGSASKSATPVASAPPQLFLDEPDRTAEALATFEPLDACVYSQDYLGDSSNEFMECDCVDETHVVSQNDDGSSTTVNSACGENSNCINRLTLIECVDELCEHSCGKDCQNQRFQRRQYADISVFLTEHKGYGVRAMQDLEPHDFVYEYIGEVIDEPEFRDRMVSYDRLGLKHFYFMMLQTGQFIDATRKGCLARFCNHSCNPNAYVNKWVVNGKLKMGIFAKRSIARGEEITFDYNVDRYGATAQKCYCGEPNCIGFMGGKTQTDAASLLPQAYAEALGVGASKEKRWIKERKAAGQEIAKNDTGDNINEEFVQSLELDPCDNIKDVAKVMSVLLQCENVLVASKLFERLWLTYDYDDENEDDIELKQILLQQIVKLHGYQCFKNVLGLFKDDDELLQDALELLYNLPRTTKNMITASHIDDQVRHIGNKYPDLKDSCDRLLNKWDGYEMYTRITKKDISAATSSATLNKLVDQRRIRLPPGWEIAQENGRPIYVNRAQNRKLLDPPVMGTQASTIDPEVHAQLSRSRPRSSTGSPFSIAALPTGPQNKVHKSRTLTEDEFKQKRKRIEEEEQRKLLAARQAEAEREKARFERESKKKDLLDQIIADANKTKEMERLQAQKLAEEKQRRLIERKNNHHTSHQEHKWERFFASFVPNLVNKYHADVPLSHDIIKQCSRDIVKTLSQKEVKRNANNLPPAKVDKHKHEKVKNFTTLYMDKFVEKLRNRQSKK